jgi:hypothetical protein
VEKWDVFVEGHVLYVADRQGVYTVSPSGRRRMVRFGPTGFDVGTYKGVEEWWGTSSESPGGRVVVSMTSPAARATGKRARRRT